MNYKNITGGIFRERPNRFEALVDVNGISEICHVKNTGRCRELLIPGAAVILEKASSPLRKTGWDLVAVYKGDRLINMDSQAPNKAVLEWLEKERDRFGLTLIKPEAVYGKSRIDFYLERINSGRKERIFMEVKGVTLEKNGAVFFPDAPTERGIKHVAELTAAVKEGFEAWILFVVQMKGVKYFSPNMDTHPAFGRALSAGRDAGVHIAAMDCLVTEDSMTISEPVQVIL